MVRPASFNKHGIKSGVWSKEEDETLRAFIHKHGHRNWQKLPIFSGLARSGKSCRLRWVNYLQPGLKKDQFSKEEVDLIMKLHNQFGNRWSAIAERLPGRTDNDVKNQWHAHIKKRGGRKVVTRAKMGHDEQEKSFDHTINGCKKSSATFSDQDSSSAEKTNVEVYVDHSFFSTDLPPFPEEESNAFGLCNKGTPSNSSYGDHTLDLPPFAEEEFFDFGLHYNHTPTTFGLCHSATSTFPDLTDEDDHTFSQLTPLIPEEELFSTLGLCHNDTPTSLSDTLDGMIRQLNNIDLQEEFSDLPCLIHQTVESLNTNHWMYNVGDNGIYNY